MDYREYRERYPLAEGRPRRGRLVRSGGHRIRGRPPGGSGRKRAEPLLMLREKGMSDFYFPDAGSAKQGPVVAGVTAGGTDHRLANE